MDRLLWKRGASRRNMAPNELSTLPCRTARSWTLPGTMWQVHEATQACPEGLYVVGLWT